LPAQLLKQPNLGTVAPGKLADIIVVDGDPLTDMSSLWHVVKVVKNGKVYK
jgi:imidazolonepropionase-like amidohydrolase